LFSGIPILLLLSAIVLVLVLVLVIDFWSAIGVIGRHEDVAIYQIQRVKIDNEHEHEHEHEHDHENDWRQDKEHWKTLNRYRNFLAGHLPKKSVFRAAFVLTLRTWTSK
jgi:hypothetical protein